MLRVTLRGSSVPAVTLGSGETLLFGRSPGLPAADPHVQLRRHVLALPNCARHISRLLGELAVADDVVRLRWRRTTEAQLSSLFDAPGGARRVTLVKGMSALLDEGENHIVVLRGWSTGPDEYADIVLSVDVAQVVPADEPVIVGDLSDPDGAATGPAPTLEPRSREWYVALALAERLGRPGADRGARRLGAGTGRAAGRRSPATPAGTAGRRYSRGARGLGRVRRVGAVGRGTGRRAARCRAPPADRAPPGAGNARPPAARRLLRDAGRRLGGRPYALLGRPGCRARRRGRPLRRGRAADRRPGRPPWRGSDGPGPVDSRQLAPAGPAAQPGAPRRRPAARRPGRRARPGPTRLRLVTLAEFTGANWSATATYRPLGAEASTALPPGRNQVRLDATVIVAALDGPWLPSPGAPLAHDVASAAVPAGATVQPYLRTPRLPRLFAEYARQVSFGASTPFEQAVAIEAAVRADRRHDPGAPTGSSYARLETFLFREEGAEPGARSGTAEQFATAFAVLARAVGLPTRVVVGFRLGDPDATGTRVVYGRDAHAWPEVYFSGWGWYAFDPMPFGDDTANPDAQAKKLALDRVTSLASGSSTPASPVPASPTAPRQPPSAQPAGQAPAGTGGRLLSVPIGRVAGGTALAVLLPLVLLALARRIRRARHRMAGARGAWSEVLDLLVLLGRPAPGWLPAPEVAAELAAAVPAPGEPVHPALRIARAADRAAFAPEPPEPAPGEAWAALRRAVRAAVPWRRRLVWPVNPRPLLRWRPRPPR